MLQMQISIAFIKTGAINTVGKRQVYVKKLTKGAKEDLNQAVQLRQNKRDEMLKNIVWVV